MAGDWIQMQKATASKPEILRIAHQLKCSVGDAFLLCFRFWCWCDDQLVDGIAKGMTTELLDSLLGRDGISAALIEVDWLQVRSGSLVVPHFDRHLSESAKKRALSRKRQADFKSNANNAPALPEKRREEGEKKKEIKTPPTPSLNFDQPDWLVVEFEFLSRWNSLNGVIKQSGNAMPNNLLRQFQESWLTPGWWERAEEAMRKFPLKNGVRISLRKFLEPTTIDEIIGGLHDFDRGGGGRKKNTKGGAMSALEREFGARMDEIDHAHGGTK